MTTVNRSVLVVRPRQSYFDWASSVDDEAAGAVDARRESDWFSVYLVDQDPHEENESAPLEDYFEEIFHRELSNWYTDASVWPQKRTLEVFTDWFEVCATSIVTDLGQGVILHDDDS